MFSLLWFAACDGAIAFAGSFTTVLVLRTLFGFGMGAEWTAGTTLAMENWPARSRGIASGVLQGSWAVGYLLAALVAGWVVPIWGWRALFLIAACPALLVLPIRIWVPESPEWKASKTRKKADTPGFTKAVVNRMVWASLVLAVAFSAYYGLTGLYPTMLKTELHFDSVRAGNVIALFNIGMMAGAIACGITASKRSMAAAIILPAMLVLPILPLYVGTVESLLWLGAFLGGAFGAGYSGVTPLLLSTLFPAEVRGRAVGIVYHAGAFAAAFVPMSMAYISATTGLTLAETIGIGVGIFQVGLAALILFRPRALSVLGAGAPEEQPAPQAMQASSAGR
jgi:SHS family lactate transporter-like MFS transporter